MVNYRKQKKKGFTLIELLIVLLILGILVGLGVPKYMPAADTARINTFASNLAQLARDIESSGMIAQGVYGATSSSPTTLKELLSKVDYTQNPLNPFTKANMLGTVLYPVNGSVQESDKNKDTGIDVWTNDTGGVVFVVTQKDAEGNNIYDKYSTQMPHGCVITSYTALGVDENEPMVNKQAKVREHMKECKDSGIFMGNPQGMGLCPATMKWNSDIMSHHSDTLDSLVPNTSSTLESYVTIFGSPESDARTVANVVYKDKDGNLQSCLYIGYISNINEDTVFTLQTALADKWMFDITRPQIPVTPASIEGVRSVPYLTLKDRNGNSYVYTHNGVSYALRKQFTGDRSFIKVYSMAPFFGGKIFTGASMLKSGSIEEFGSWFYADNDSNMGVPIVFDTPNYGGGVPMFDGTGYFCWATSDQICSPQLGEGVPIAIMQTLSEGWTPSWNPDGTLTSLPPAPGYGVNFSHYYSTGKIESDGKIHFYRIPSLDTYDVIWAYGIGSKHFVNVFSITEGRIRTLVADDARGPYTIVDSLNDVEWRGYEINYSDNIYSVSGVYVTNNNQPVTCTSSDGINWTCTPQ